MKRKQVRRYLRHIDDYMEEIERKMKCMDKTLFLISVGLEYFCQQEDCIEANAVLLVQDYLKSIRTGEIAGLQEVLSKLKEV